MSIGKDSVEKSIFGDIPGLCPHIGFQSPTAIRGLISLIQNSFANMPMQYR